jgi:hypothetical protein
VTASHLFTTATIIRKHRKQRCRSPSHACRCILGNVARVGDHHCDRLADIMNLVFEQALFACVALRWPDSAIASALAGGASDREDRLQREPHGPRELPVPLFYRDHKTWHGREANVPKQACKSPGSFISSTKRPLPASKAGSSSRFTCAPKHFALIFRLPSYADQTISDHKAFAKAVRDGRIQAIVEQ